MKLIKKIVLNVKNLFRLKDNPEKIARGFALGSFIGMLPIPGLQVLVALGMSSLFKVNKKAACVAVFNTNIATGAFVFAFNYWLGKQLLGYSSSFSFPDKINIHFLSTIIKAGSEVTLSLVLGGLITGLITAVLAYFAIKGILAAPLKKALKAKQIKVE